jgi:hypothetical protein
MNDVVYLSMHEWASRVCCAFIVFVVLWAWVQGYFSTLSLIPQTLSLRPLGSCGRIFTRKREDPSDAVEDSSDDVTAAEARVKRADTHFERQHVWTRRNNERDA